MSTQNTVSTDQPAGIYHHKTSDALFRTMAVYAGLAIFSVFAFFSMDSNIFVDPSSVELPFAGQVPFTGFMVTVPVLFIAMRVVLGVQVGKLQHDKARTVPAKESETFNSLSDKTMTVLMFLALEILFPAVLLLLAWKAAVFPVLGTGLLIVAFVCISFQLYKICKWSPLKHMVATVVVFGVLVVVAGQQNTFYFKRGPALQRFQLTTKILDYEDLSGATIKGGAIVTSNLQYVDLSGATIIETIIVSSLLKASNLTGSTIVATKFVSSFLDGTDFGGSMIKSSDFSNSDVSKSNFSGATITDTEFNGALLKFVDFSRANLTGVDFTNVDFYRADFKSARFENTNLTGAILYESKNITQQQLDAACVTNSGNRPLVPEGLKPPTQICSGQ